MPRKPKINREAADRAVSFIERLKHTKGKWAGVPFTLLPWQRDEIIRPLFGTLRSDGTRQYRTAYVEIPKKNGKSELAAGIALKLLFADKEPGAEIYSAAADRDQASIVFNVAAQMVRQSPALMGRCKIIDSQKRIVIPKTGSFYRVLSSDAFTKHGFNVHGVIFDELHAQPNRELWDVLTLGAGDARTQPLTFAITTAGYDRNSVCWEQHEYALKVLKGIIQDPTFLPVVYAAEEADDWEDEAVWKKANPSLGHTLDIERIREAYRKAKEMPALQNAFRRLRLNQWTQQETRWADISAWDATAGIVAPENLKGRHCYAGLDLASTMDIAALALVFPGDGVFEVVMWFWIPEENMRERINRDRVPYDVWVRQGLVQATPGNVIDYGAIKHTIKTLAAEFEIQEIAFDRWGAVQISQDLDAEGFTMVPFGQGFASMSGPTKELLNLVLSKKFRHGGNPVLRWMADNMVVKQDPAGNVKPDKSKSTQKIDGMVALIMALDRAMRHQETGSVYDQRGIRTL